MKKNSFHRFSNWFFDSLGWWGLGCLENSFFLEGFSMTSVPRHVFSRQRFRTKDRILTGLGVLFLISVFVPRVMAQDLSPNQRWIEQVDGGAVFPASKANAAGFGAGIGGDILVGYRFDRNFSLSGDIGYYDCDQKDSGAATGEWLYTPLMAVARFNFGPGWMRPYVLLGMGLAFNTYSITPAYSGIKTSQQATDLLVSPGAGFLFVVANNMALYVQGRVDISFTPAGAPGNPFTDSPSLFIPVKAGLSFFVL